ncbi:MAG TPA: FkbM family methyltransferase [Methylomirabilota bacterium]|nr:FkbM family methyltransferase [Methylomirabilota bacterium]
MALLEKLRQCERYQKAPSWQKPFIAPGRFLHNQLAKRAQPVSGEVRHVDAFHYPQFAIVNGEIVSEQLAFYGYFEADLTEAIIRLVRPGDIAVDIGMHLGYYTSLLAQLVGPQGQVHSFEPTPSTRELAARNVSKFSNITVHSFAMWSEKTELPFKDYGLKWLAFNSFSKARLEEEPAKPREYQVQTTTLDNFRSSLRKPIAFVKIDAESAEHAIIKGAKSLLKQDAPVLSLELGDFHQDQASRAIIEELSSVGYSAWELNGGRFVRHTPRADYDYCNLIFATEARAATWNQPS